MKRLCKVPKLIEGKILKYSSSKILIKYKDSYFLLENKCSHEDFSLEKGFVDIDDGTIECPRHGARFDIITGAAISLPAVKPIQVYKIKEKEGYLYLLEN